MKHSLKSMLLIGGLILGIILIDSIQALVFNHSPLIKIREYYDGDTLHYKDKGILVDTFSCQNGKKGTTLKGFSYSCSFLGGEFILLDKTKDMNDFACAEVLESFYEDDKYVYYWNCMKNEYMVVQYDDGTEEPISEALKNNRIDIEVLGKFEIDYIKYTK